MFIRKSSYVFNVTRNADAVYVLEFVDCKNCSSLSSDIKKVWHRRATAEQRSAIYNRENGHCHYCKADIEFNSFHADHKNPWFRSHNSDLTNLVAACYKCNIAKHTLSYDRYKELLSQKGIKWRNQKYYMTAQSFRKSQKQLTV